MLLGSVIWFRFITRKIALKITYLTPPHPPKYLLVLQTKILKENLHFFFFSWAISRVVEEDGDLGEFLIKVFCFFFPKMFDFLVQIKYPYLSNFNNDNEQ